MADISMCEDSKCPSKNKCHRYTAIPNEHWQAYSDFNRPVNEDKCKYFINNKEYEKRK